MEVVFKPTSGPDDGLRSLSREQLDFLCTQAKCTILSSISNSYIDAYVLSESSLFIYKSRFIMKTCGTTTLLRCLSSLLQFADALGMELTWVGYSRKNLLFPSAQVESLLPLKCHCSLIIFHYLNWWNITSSAVCDLHDWNLPHPLHYSLLFLISKLLSNCTIQHSFGLILILVMRSNTSLRMISYRIVWRGPVIFSDLLQEITGLFMLQITLRHRLTWACHVNCPRFSLQ